jgi:hypothetical protein
MCGTDLSGDDNSESMMKMFLNLPEVITQGVSKVHEELSKYFYADYDFKDSLEEKDSLLAALYGIQDFLL